MAKNYTKNLIKQEFIKLLNKKSLHNITVTEIAKQCKIERKTFYYHYENLPQLVKEIFDEELEDVIKEFNETLSWEESFISAEKFILDKIYEDQIRVEDLTKKIERLYDDWLDNKISESNFQKILEKSQNEQDYLNQRIEDNQKLIVKEDLEDINVKKWIELIKKHRDIKKLDKETLNELISKIYVHEKEVVNGEITQTIDIYYNFIGNTDTLQVFYNL